jgi:hypothetical protein
MHQPFPYSFHLRLADRNTQQQEIWAGRRRLPPWVTGSQRNSHIERSSQCGRSGPPLACGPTAADSPGQLPAAPLASGHRRVRCNTTHSSDGPAPATGPPAAAALCRSRGGMPARIDARPPLVRCEGPPWQQRTSATGLGSRGPGPPTDTPHRTAPEPATPAPLVAVEGDIVTLHFVARSPDGEVRSGFPTVPHSFPEPLAGHLAPLRRLVAAAGRAWPRRDAPCASQAACPACSRPQVIESTRGADEPLSFEIGAGEVMGNPIFKVGVGWGGEGPREAVCAGQRGPPRNRCAADGTHWA